MRLGRPFGVLWGSTSLSNLADGLAFVSMPLLAASLTDDPRLVAGLATLYAVVRLVVALPVGVYVDRLERRTLIAVANLLRGVALVALALALQLGEPGILALYAAMALVGTLESAADTASVALLPSLVPRDRLDRANSRVAATQLVADEFVGPPLGGALFAVAVALPVYAMGGLWAAAGALALALPRSRRPSVDAVEATATGAAPARSVLAEARAGVQWLRGHRVVGSLAAIGALASVGYMLPFSVLVLFARDRLGLDASGYGLLLAASALGGLAGAWLAPRLRSRVGHRGSITAALALGAVSLLALALTGNPLLAGVALAAYILHAVVWNIGATSLRQRLVPSGLLGRVGAASRVLGLLGLAAGSALGGALAVLDLRVPTLAGAVLFAACVPVAWRALRDLGPADGPGQD